MNEYNISIVMPSINPDKWQAIFNQLQGSINSFELICVGPKFPTEPLQYASNFYYIRDFGCPSRAFQLGSTIAKGKYIAFIPDDCIIEPMAFQKCFELLESKTDKDALTLIYTEGPGYTGNQHIALEYWTAHTHGSLRLKQIQSGWQIAPCFMYNLNYFRKMGGLDCSFEHINMNTHDLAFRTQRDGGIIYLSPGLVFRADWHPWDNNNKSPIQLAFEENDNPLFSTMYSSDTERPLIINYDNWRNSPSCWPRRFKFT